jgi:hypothetical protein
MNALSAIGCVGPRFELRFQSLFDEGRGFSFPCDEAGNVDIDALSDRGRNNYLYARAVVGVEFATPAIQYAEDDGE